MRATLPRAGRARATVTLTGLAVLTVAVLFGLVVFVWSVANHTGPSHDRPATRPTATAPDPLPDTTGRTQSAEDALAAEPMLAVPMAAALPQPLTTGPVEDLPLPAPTDPSAPVPHGFPRTPAGAVAQLAAIDTAAFAGLTPATVAAVYRQSTTAGAVRLEDWTPRVGVTGVLTRLGHPDGSPEVTGSWSVTHGQVKGVLDGGEFVVACVLGELQATYRTGARAAVGDCQRMVWTGGRWLIGPGAQPAFAPSTWPGSADCVRAGWLEVTHHA